MIVRFIRGRRTVLAGRVMSVVPRRGEGVMLDPGAALVVWNVGWDLPEDGEPVAWVSVKTDREYRLALAGPHAGEERAGQPV